MNIKIPASLLFAVYLWTSSLTPLTSFVLLYFPGNLEISGRVVVLLKKNITPSVWHTAHVSFMIYVLFYH